MESGSCHSQFHSRAKNLQGIAMKIKTVLLLFSICFVSGCGAGNESEPKVVFLIPEGYLGPLKVSGSHGGRDVKQESEEYLIDVPPSGRVVLKDLEFLRKWHRLSARYKSGKPIAEGDFDSQGESVRFFSLWAESSGDTYYFVGTLEEFEEIERSGPWEIEKCLPRVPTGQP